MVPLFNACRSVIGQLQAQYGHEEGLRIWNEMSKGLPEDAQKAFTLNSISYVPPPKLSAVELLNKIRERKRV